MANQETVQSHAHDHDHNHDHAQGTGCGIPKFNTRDLIVKEDIMAKAKELAGLISNSEEIKHFQRAEKQIQGHQRVQDLIAQMKKKQKEIVAFESFQNAKMVSKIEAEIEALQDELDGIPIIGEFQQSQVDVNYLMQLVISVIRDTVSEKISVEDATSEDPEECIE